MKPRTKKKINYPINYSINIKNNNPEFTKYMVLIVFTCFNYPKKKSITILKKFRNLGEIIPENYSDRKLNEIYNFIIKQRQNIKQEIKKVKNGGYYLKRLEEKEDKPITGSDLTRLLDELQGITGNFRYAPEGKFLGKADIMINLMRGDEESLKSYIKFFILPNFYKIFPIPHLINIFGVDKNNPPNDYVGKTPLWERYEDIGDYLLTYQAYQKARNQYYVDKGMAPPDVLEPGFMEKLTEDIDKIATKYSRTKSTLTNPTTGLMM
jgi:hypothetical protein